LRTHFTADQHFGHAGIIPSAGRPFASVEEMDAHLIACWNGVVAPNDTVWHVGDFAHRCDPKRKAAIFNKLHGVKNLVAGNHDEEHTRTELGWSRVGDYAEITVDGQRIVLSHYAMRVWNGQHRGAIMLYGHSHARLPGSTLSLDVGVDAWSFMPVDLPQIRARLEVTPDEPENDGGGGFTP
jgi:calcineurin-like phosphoesterase family protein